MKRNSVLIYKSTAEMLRKIKRENSEYFIDAIEMVFDYAFDGIEPDMEDSPIMLDLFWEAVRPLIDANNRNYVNGCKGGAPSESMKGNQNARKKKTTGNKPSATENKPKTNRKQTENKGNDNVNDNVNDNEEVKVNVNDNDNDNDNVNDKNTPQTPQGGQLPNGTELPEDEGWRDPRDFLV